MIKIDNITDEQKSNLKKLADYLYTNNPIKKFDMKYYVDGDDIGDYRPYHLKKYYNKCGTVACAAGHGPMAGIEALYGEDWRSYIDRNFVNSEPALFDWLFSSLWAPIDNTPKGAAKRIYYFLENESVPDDYLEQMEGLNPLCYSLGE